MSEMRARNIKPKFFLNEELGKCSMAARMLFIGLWLVADREGLVVLKNKEIKAQIFPYDKVNINNLLEQLDKSGQFIQIYEIDGQKYLKILNFKKHQNPHPHEAKSVIPQPISGNAITCNDMSSTCNLHDMECRADSLNPESLNPESLNPETSSQIPSKKIEGICDQKPVANPKVNPLDKPGDGNPVFCSYPLKEKGKVFELCEDRVRDYEERFPGIRVRQELLKALRWTEKAPYSKRKGRSRFLCFLTNWLNRAFGEAEEDEYPLPNVPKNDGSWVDSEDTKAAVARNEEYKRNGWVL